MESEDGGHITKQNNSKARQGICKLYKILFKDNSACGHCFYSIEFI